MSGHLDKLRTGDRVIYTSIGNMHGQRGTVADRRDAEDGDDPENETTVRVIWDTGLPGGLMDTGKPWNIRLARFCVQKLSLLERIVDAASSCDE